MHRATVLMSLRLECSVNCACVMVIFCTELQICKYVEYCDIHFVYGFCNGNARAAVVEYQGIFPTEGFRLEVFLLVLTRHCVILAVFQVLLCGLKGTHERTFLRWFREVHICPLVEWPLASAYHVCRCGELYMRKIYILTKIKGYNIWNQATMLNVWICAAG